MRAVTVNTGESYDMLAGQLKAEGIIPAIPDKRYFEQYMRGIQYWTGDGWSNTPVINRRYREARERMDREAGRQGTPEASSR
jgi:hypothetical protein